MLGVLVGICVPLIGVAAAVGLILFFVGAIITHLRSRDYYSLGVPIGLLLLAIAALTLELYARGAGRICSGGAVAGIINAFDPTRYAQV